MSIVHKTYQRRGYLTRDGYARLDAVLASQAWLYNQALEMRKKAYEIGGVQVTWQDQFKWLTGMRHTHKKRMACLALQVQRGTLLRLDRAFQSFFRRVKAGQKPGFPRFKTSRNRFRTIELAEVTPSMVRNGKVKIKGLPVIHVKGGGLPDSTQLKSLRITRHGRRVTISLGYAVKVAPLPPSDACVGIDMGVTDRLALSNGETFPRRVIDWHDVAEKQRRLARCVKGSREWKKRARILANAQGRDRIRNRNECHRITSGIVQQHGHIAVEDLEITNMTASARGTVDNPGVNVAAKAGLNREIETQTWGMIRQQLTYKAEWAGRTLIAVEAKHTSQTCGQCG